MDAHTDQRRILRRLLTAEALITLPAIGAPAELDPIFGLVAAHKAAWAQFMELDERDHETFEEGGRAADAAMYELMKTPPTTLAGMRAIIQYLVDLDDDSGYYYLQTLLRSPLLVAWSERAHTSEGGFSGHPV
jgi:hypothetical protein